VTDSFVDPAVPPSTEKTLQRLIDRCACGVTLTVNEHRDVYESVELRLDEYYASMSSPSHVDPEVRAKMIETDTIIDLHFYPDTPIGSYSILHYSLAAALQVAHEILDEARPRGPGELPPEGPSLEPESTAGLHQNANGYTKTFPRGQHE
jgi:hypothetical protein